MIYPKTNIWLKNNNSSGKKIRARILFENNTLVVQYNSPMVGNFFLNLLLWNSTSTKPRTLYDRPKPMMIQLDSDFVCQLPMSSGNRCWLWCRLLIAWGSRCQGWDRLNWYRYRLSTTLSTTEGPRHNFDSIGSWCWNLILW